MSSNVQGASQELAANPSGVQHAPETNQPPDGSTRFWRGLQLSNGRQTGLRNLFVGYEGQVRLTGLQLKETITEELTPTELAHPDVVINPEIYKRLRLFLESRGISCDATRRSGRLIPRRVICALFESGDEQECMKALSRYDAVKRGDDVIITPSSSPHYSDQNPHPFAADQQNSPRDVQFRETAKGKISKVFAANFRTNSDKFSGALEENWPRFLTAYQQVCEEAGVRASEKVQFMRHLLRGEALDFYYDQVIDKTGSWGAAVASFNEAYSSESKMDAVTERLRSLTLSDYESEEKGERQALKDLTKDIERLSPMAHPQLRNDFHKGSFLESAVKDREWALMVSTNHAVMKMPYVQFRTTLEKFQTKWTSFGKSPQSQRGPLGSNSFRASRWKVNYAGPAKFGRPSSLTSPTPRRTLRCFNCEEENCRVNTCKKPIDLARVARNLAQFRTSRSSASQAQFTEVFYEIAQVLLTAGKEGTLSLTNEGEATDSSDTDSQELGTQPARQVGFLDDSATAINFLDPVSASASVSPDIDDGNWPDGDEPF